MRFVFLISLLGMGMACDQEAQKAEVPVFLTLQDAQVQSPVAQDGNTHAINEVWIYADSLLLGAFPIPGTVPIIPKRETILVEIHAGIRENGQASQPVIYPFYASLERVIRVVEGGNQTINLGFSYLSHSKFAWVETFDGQHSLKDDIDQNEGTRIVIASSPMFSGGVGRGFVTSADPELEVASSFPVDDIPTDGSPVFLELDFVGDIDLAVGLRGRSQAIPPVSAYKIVLFATEDREKVYIDFTPELQASALDAYQITFRASYDQQAGLDTQYIYLDNIKWIHF